MRRLGECGSGENQSAEQYEQAGRGAFASVAAECNAPPVTPGTGLP
jgi:hypothetical protein